MLVIFDCDGVLVDSETIANETLYRHLTALGLSTSPQACDRRYRGRSMAACVGLIEAQLGRALPEDFLEGLQRDTFSQFERQLTAIPGVVEIVARLHAAAVPFCVASSGSHAKLRLTLTKTGLWSYFAGRIYSAEDVERGKPAPDLFLHAATQMGVDPQLAWVVEDSLPGVEAGLAAQMQVLAYHSDKERPAPLPAAGAVTCFSAMAELPALLGLE
ncbi:HAD family hydrolase [Exilibacterium tricleocarpae]|uniref:HAD family hydrolase n=1 Tax=Exilibacterium tricleocarpae TaxID=2591008 RepID=A0A545STI8_9GAMM|nr:HAD family hydrolase [Exilibacterium tricleocarpae]TQV68287.1 HAD family hydrolase [Exilibacterium tricleocarpae]